MEIVFDYDHPEHPTHFIDHHWWEKSRCESFQRWPRGLRVHWRYWNEFKKEVDLGWWYRATHCWWGEHRFQQFYRGHLPDGQHRAEKAFLICRWCGKRPDELSQ